MGLRLLETLCHRERGGKRDTRLLDVLKFVHTTLWKYLFGRQARDLEQSNAVCCPDQAFVLNSAYACTCITGVLS